MTPGPSSHAFQRTALAALQNAARAEKNSGQSLAAVPRWREKALAAAVGVMMRDILTIPPVCCGSVVLIALHRNHTCGVCGAAVYRASMDMVVASSRWLDISIRWHQMPSSTLIFLINTIDSLLDS